MDRTRVVVVLGGRSTEHEISCISGRSIVEALDVERYAVRVLGITRDGRWVQHPDGGLGVIDATGALPVVADRMPQIEVGAALAADVVFPVLHGPWGEDGTVQGLFETFSVPYVGSGVLASALAMDKGAMKQVLRAAGIPVGRFEVVTDRQWLADRDHVLARLQGLGLPAFVKPARGGSSLGIVRVTDPAALVAAVESAREHDPKVVVEAAVAPAREIECGVLVGPDGAPQATRCAEIIVSEQHEFYDFAAKYLDDSATLVVPAEMPGPVEDRVRALAIRAFEALDCAGLARVDFFVRPDSEIVLNEVNTMPGFTSISMFPRMWAATGIDYPQLVDTLVADALRRGPGLH